MSRDSKSRRVKRPYVIIHTAKYVNSATFSIRMGCSSSTSAVDHVNECKPTRKQKSGAKKKEEAETVRRQCPGCGHKRNFSVSSSDIFCKKCKERLRKAAATSEFHVHQSHNIDTTSLLNYLNIYSVYTSTCIESSALN